MEHYKCLYQQDHRLNFFFVTIPNSQLCGRQTLHVAYHASELNWAQVRSVQWAAVKDCCDCIVNWSGQKYMQHLQLFSARGLFRLWPSRYLDYCRRMKMATFTPSSLQRLIELSKNWTYLENRTIAFVHVASIFSDQWTAFLQTSNYLSIDNCAKFFTKICKRYKVFCESKKLNTTA